MTTHESGHFRSCTNQDTCYCETKRYIIALIISLAICAVEVIGSIITNSLAVLADALHVITDVVSYAVSITVSVRVKKYQEAEKQQLRRRGGIINQVLLIGICVWIIYEATSRYLNPPDRIIGGGMIIVALVGSIGNFFQHRALHGLEHTTGKSQRQHIITDLGMSIMVAIAGTIILLWDIQIIDPILSFSFGLYMFWQASRLLVQIWKGNQPIHTHHH